MLFGIDASSAQGSVVWSKVAKVCAFGFEKVTQGTSYENPFWSSSKDNLLAEKNSGAFIPGAYLFLDEGNGAAQADFFASKAGNLDGWLIAVDAEPNPGSGPTQSDLTAVVNQLRIHYPNSLIGGYCPEWYWGAQSLTQFDWLWASHYVLGSGSIESLYSTVPDYWWVNYGERSVDILQFTDQASVAGCEGTVDASAFRGTFQQLKALTTKTTVIPTRPTPVTEASFIEISGDDMGTFVLQVPISGPVNLPVPAGSKQLILLADPTAPGMSRVQPKIRVGTYPTWTEAVLTPHWGVNGVHSLPEGTTVVTISRQDNGLVPITVTFQ